MHSLAAQGVSPGTPATDRHLYDAAHAAGPCPLLCGHVTAKRSIHLNTPTGCLIPTIAQYGQKTYLAIKHTDGVSPGQLFPALTPRPNHPKHPRTGELVALPFPYAYGRRMAAVDPPGCRNGVLPRVREEHARGGVRRARRGHGSRRAPGRGPESSRPSRPARRRAAYEPSRARAPVRRPGGPPHPTRLANRPTCRTRTRRDRSPWRGSHPGPGAHRLPPSTCDVHCTPSPGTGAGRAQGGPTGGRGAPTLPAQGPHGGLTRPFGRHTP